MFVRDRSRLADIRKRMNTCPLGAGALAGTTYPLDREYTAQLLGFDGPTRKKLNHIVSVRILHNYDAYEPFLRRDHHVELQ